MTRSWRLRPLLREAAMNVCTGGARTALLLCALTTAMTGAAVFEAVSVQTIIERDADLIERGRYVIRITAGSNSATPVDAAACERLTGQGGVEGAGAVLNSRLVEVASSPGVRIRLIHATPGAMHVLHLSGDSTPGVVAGIEGAEELAIVKGSRLVLNDLGSTVDVVVDQIAPPSRRLREADRAIVIASVPRGAASECFVEVSPTVFDEYRGGGVSALAALTDGDPQIATLVRVEQGQTPSDRYAKRPSRYAALVSATFAIALFVVNLQTRRSEIGVYRATGTRPSALFVILFVEHIIIITTTAAILVILSTTAVLVMLDNWHQPSRHALSTIATAATLATAGIAPVLALIARRRNVLQSLKDR